VTAAIFYVAFGDTAAALVGRTIGRQRWPGMKKSLEGSLACLLTCALVGLGLKLAPAPLLCGALAATLIEIVPTTRFYNDNLWMPVLSASVLRLFS